jgi:hypothetical protein
LAVILVAVAIEHLHTWLPPVGLFFGSDCRAAAQVIPDPGFGDPYATGGYGDAQHPAPPIGIAQPNFPNNFGPSAPANPMSPTRPPSWPGGPGAQAPGAPPGGFPVAPGVGAVPPGANRVATSPPGPAVGAPQGPPKKSPSEPPYDPAEIVAHVGSEVIQASEILPLVNQQVVGISKEHAAELGQLSPQERDEQLNPIRRELMKRSVDEIVKVKLLLSELRRKVPAEALQKQEKLLREHFNSNEIKRMMEVNKAASIPDLEAKLRQLGTSLDSQRSVFVERQLAGMWLNEHTKNEPQPPTHEGMLTYYRLHAADWATPARVRWEQLTVKYSNFNSKAQATAALARWGNDIYVRGVPFATVAKAHSQDVAADEGGMHDWASQGSLRSTILDEALFVLPVGALSQIIADEDGLHIVRVVEREAARQAPFTEVQREIKKTLQNSSKEKRQTEYLAKLQERIPVWTIFDDDFVARTSQPIAPTTR